MSGVVGGANIVVDDSLVLALDAADNQSFRGEPTTNLTSGVLLNNDGGVPITTVETTGPDGDLVTVSKVTITRATELVRILLQENIGMPTSGQYYTISCWVKRANSVNATGGWEVELNNDPIYSYARPSFEQGFIGEFGAHPNTQTFPTEWTRVSYTFLYNYQPTSSILSFLYLSGLNSEILFYKFQVEAKPYATPFVNGTRGTTVTTGGGWADMSGLGNHGEIINTPTYDASNRGSLVFDGIDDNVNVPYSSNIDFGSGNKQFSINFWINFNSLNPTSRVAYFKRSDWDYGLGISQQWVRVHNNNDGNIYYPDYSVNLLTGLWYYFSQVFTGYGIGNTFFYINSQPQTISVNNTATNRPLSNVGINFQENNDSFNISQVQIYNRALTPQEIQRNYIATKSRYGL